MNFNFQLRVGFCNVNSLLNKLSFVYDLIVDNDLHIFGITESWLLSSIPDSFVMFDNFSIVRTDTRGNLLSMVSVSILGGTLLMNRLLLLAQMLIV